jgi:quinol monooxygenase YgiN
MDEQPMTMVVIFRARPGLEETLGDALRALVGPTRAEAGCLAYDLHRSIEEPDVYFFTETWASAAHHRAHDATGHVRAFGVAKPDLLAEPMLMVKGIRLDG